MASEQLVCPRCGNHYDAHLPIWKCSCGSYLDLNYRHPFSMEGWGAPTPLMPMNYAGVSFLAKMDMLLPTGSFKDRGAICMIQKCKSLGLTQVVEDSSGNAACAIAAACAREGISAHIFMPEGNSTGKVVQARSYGAQLHLVTGSREECTRQALEAASESYYASHAWNPYFMQGTRSVWYEMVAQLGKAPDVFIMPVGNGTQLLGAFLGMQEMISDGIMSKYSRLIAVKSPIPEKGTMLAEGIAVRHPVRDAQIQHALQVTGGCTVTVADEQLVPALKAAALQGVFMEPTSAVAVAALAQCAHWIPKGSTVTVSITGNGLKSTTIIDKLYN